MKASRVSKEEFFNAISSLGVTLSVEGPYPFRTTYKRRNDQTVVGWQDYDWHYYLPLSDECS